MWPRPGGPQTIHGTSSQLTAHQEAVHRATATNHADRFGPTGEFSPERLESRRGHWTADGRFAGAPAEGCPDIKIPTSKATLGMLRLKAPEARRLGHGGQWAMFPPSRTGSWHPSWDDVVVNLPFRERRLVRAAS